MADAARSSLEVGSTVAGTYTIEAQIGRGGMGAVFLASHARLPGKQVAIKVLHAHTADAEAIARFRHEAEIASRLNHPNIVQVHDYNTLPDGTPYLVLEYLAGETLAARLARGPIELDRALRIVRQIGAALAIAHREGIVHRDLKPGNVFLVADERDGDAAEVAKLLDFGISKLPGSDSVRTQQSSLLGTPQYMAPEQATGDHDKADARTDLFAFGTIVYEMLSGQPAFAGGQVAEVVFRVVYEQPKPLRDLAPALPVAIVEAVMRAMAKKPDQRFANASAFVEALTGTPLSMSRAPTPRPFPAQQTPPGGVGVVTTVASVPPERRTPAPVLPPGMKGVDANAETVATADNRARPNRLRWLVVGGVVALVAGAAAYLALGRGDTVVAAPDASRTAPGADATARADAAPVAVADAAMAAPDAAVMVVAVVDARAAVDARTAADHGDAAVAALDPRLEAAERALANRSPDDAASLASAVVEDKTVPVAQRDQAHGLLGAIACSVNNNVGDAQTQMRQIKDGAQARARIAAACRAAGYDVDPHE